MKAIILTLAIIFLAACVQIDQEVQELPVIEADVPEPPAEEPIEEPGDEKSAEPTPTALAPLPEKNDTKMSKTSGSAVLPKSVPVQSTPTKQQVASGWTTESLSIGEGETKYVYVNEP